MHKRESPKAWTAYRLAKVGKRLGVVYGKTENEALANAQRSSPRRRLRRSGFTSERSDAARRTLLPLLIREIRLAGYGTLHRV